MKINREVERSADVSDQASAVSDLLLEASLSRQKAASAPERHVDFDGKHCVECGVDMPAARLKLERVRCFDCQTVLEATRRCNR